MKDLKYFQKLEYLSIKKITTKHHPVFVGDESLLVRKYAASY